MSIKIISINVRGLGDVTKRRAIFNFYRKRGDIVCLQETHSTDSVEVIWTSEWQGDIIFSHGTSKARGVCFLLPKGAKKKIKDIKIDTAGRIVKFNYNIQNESITICGIYAPNLDTPAFFKEIYQLMEMSESQKIIVGDFNLVMDVAKDRIGTNSNNIRSVEVIKEMMAEYYLEDIWRAKNNEERKFSWYRCRPKLVASRIDFSLISTGLMDQCENVGYTTGLHTDHLAHFLYLNLSKNQKGRGYWKMNISHLMNAEFIAEMNELITSTLISCSHMELFQKWEYLKYVIKDGARTFAKQQIAQSELIIAQLSEKVTELEDNLESANLDLLLRTKADLNDFATEKAKGCIFRSKAKYAELGEKPTKYFFNLEKARYEARTCNALFDEEGGEMVTNTDKILKLQEKFYRSLYTSDKTISFNLDNTYGIKVSEDHKILQQEPFTQIEIATAVKALPNGKTCGCDGIPIDFYKMFWTKLKGIYFELVQEIYVRKKLPTSATLGIINLIPKPLKDTTKLQNLRPISILNSDYKILEKMMANRIEPALSDIINVDQRGFMKNRRITTNVRMLYELITFCEAEQVEAIILSLDFMKCFDRIEFQTIIKSMRFFGFAEYLIEWTEILYKDSKANTQNNGHFSKRFPLLRGLHQGGPCSSLYFLICAEVMALLLRNNQEIEGIEVRDLLNLLGQYADDADLYLLHKQKTIDSVFLTLETFRSLSGFTVNYDKTNILRIGSLRNSDATLTTQKVVTWTNEPINVLGIWVSPNVQQANHKNYTELLSKAAVVLQNWHHRSVSLGGKVLVVNTLIVSLFVYRMSALEFMEKDLYTEFKDMVMKFIWNGSKPKIPYDVLILPKEEGGMGLIDLATKNKALKVAWIQILKDEPKLANVVYKNIAPNLGELIWECQLNAIDVRRLIKNKFWAEVLTAWNELKMLLHDQENMSKTVIWLNSSIRINNETIFWKDCFKRDLIYVSQLYRNGTTISAIEANRRYGLDVLSYNGLISAIPMAWRKSLKSNVPLEEKFSLYQAFLNKTGIVSFAYKHLQDTKSKKIGNKRKLWELELNEQLTTEEYLLQFRNLYVTSNSTKLRSFQYRLLHRALITNIHLFRWGKMDTNLCSFCEKEKKLTLICLCYAST